MNHKTTALSLVLVGVMLFVGAFGVYAQDDNTLTIGLRNLVTIDPALGAEDQEILFNQLQYNYLINITPGGELEPSLATDWEVSEDGLTYTLTLADDVTFHDGSPLTADDVVYSFNRLVSAGSSIVGLLGQEEVGTTEEGDPIFEPTWSVEAQDENTVVFTLDEPNADFLFGVASRFSFILDDETGDVNVLAEGDDPLANFNGTGPFILTEYNPGQSATFTRNENYWQEDLPMLDQIELVFIEEAQTQVDALRTGTVDFIMRVPDDLAVQLEDAEGITVVERATNVHPVIRLRADEGSIGEDVRVRQAFKYATDRELLNLDVLDGAGAVGNNDPIGPVYGPFYSPQDNQGYDPEQACALLAEYAADNPDNPYVTMEGDTPRLEADFNVIDIFTYPVLAEFMQQQWEAGCIYVNLNVLPGSIYYGEGENNWLNSQLGLTNWGTRPVPQEYLSVAYTTGAPFNESQWSNERVDELTAQAAVTADIEERAAIYDEISGIFAEEGPIIIPYFTPIIGAYSDNVSNLDMHSFPGRTDFSVVTVGE